MKNFNVSPGLILFLIASLLSVQLACVPSKSVVPPAAKQQNHPPVIEKITYAKDVFSNDEDELTCLASDVDGDNLTYKWTCEAGNIKGDGPDVLWMPPGKLGTYPITVTVDDGNGAEVEETINIRVLTNADGTATPTVEVNLVLGDSQPVVIDGQRVRIWTTTDIICTVGNAEGHQLSYTWSANGGKITGKDVQQEKATRIGWTAPGIQSDSVINVKVADEQGREAQGQVNIHVFCCGN